MATPSADRLRELRVLITRPADRAGELLDALKTAGADTLHLPALTIAALDEHQHSSQLQRARQSILDLDHYDALIFISVNAVEHGMAMIENYWPQLPVKQTYWAIGAATCKALAERGIRAAAGDGAMNSEALLARPELQSMTHQKIAIVRGLGGRETLAHTLRERGARVDYIECYQRQAPVASASEQCALIDRFQPNCSVVNSGETLLNLSHWLPSEHPLFQCPIITPSERVTALARKLGYARPVTAENAGLDATIHALLASHVADSE